MVPSSELTYPFPRHFEDDAPFPQVGYVCSLDSIWFYTGRFFTADVILRDLFLAQILADPLWEFQLQPTAATVTQIATAHQKETTNDGNGGPHDNSWEKK